MKWEATIPMEPRTKKNSMKIAGRGNRCPVCGKHQLQYIRQGDAHDAYARKAVYFLRPRPETPIGGPVNVRCLFYMGTRRKVDLTNLLEAVDDLLVQAGILADDNSLVIVSHDGSRVLYDHATPRTEIEITDQMEG